MNQRAIGGVVQTNTIVWCNADVMAVGRARTKTTQTFFHRSQSLLVGENDRGRVTTEENMSKVESVWSTQEDERGGVSSSELVEIDSKI